MSKCKMIKLYATVNEIMCPGPGRYQKILPLYDVFSGIAKMIKMIYIVVIIMIT